MEYKTLVKDFIDRTEHNLKIIEAMKRDGDEVFEITQLINSLLGLLILPQQNFFDNIPTDSIEEARNQGWKIPDPLDGFNQANNLRDYLRYLRNGIAHFNIEFISNNEEISGIQIWNQPQKSAINWRINLKVDEIKSITNKIKELVNEL